MRILAKKLREKAIMPKQAHFGDAGCDLYACIDENIHIAPGKTVMIPTGWAIAVPLGWFGAIFARSGLAAKEGLRPANCVGVVDSHYRGEYMVALHNDSQETRMIEHGQKIAQLVIMPFMSAELVEADELDETERGEGGFGSSGK